MQVKEKVGCFPDIVEGPEEERLYLRFCCVHGTEEDVAMVVFKIMGE